MRGDIAAREASDRVGLNVVDDQRRAPCRPQRGFLVSEHAAVEGDPKVPVGIELAARQVGLARRDRLGKLEKEELPGVGAEGEDGVRRAPVDEDLVVARGLEHGPALPQRVGAAQHPEGVDDVVDERAPRRPGRFEPCEAVGAQLPSARLSSRRSSGPSLAGVEDAKVGGRRDLHHPLQCRQARSGARPAPCSCCGSSPWPEFPWPRLPRSAPRRCPAAPERRRRPANPPRSVAQRRAMMSSNAGPRTAWVANSGCMARPTGDRSTMPMSCTKATRTP